MSSEVVLVQGSEIRISVTEVVDLGESPEPDFAPLNCIGRDIQIQGGTAPEVDVTTFCSTAKEFRLGLRDSGTMTVSGHWVQTNEAHQVIRAADADKKTRLIEIEFEDGSLIRVLALVQQRSLSMAVDGVVSGTFVFRLSGEMQEIDATDA